MSAEARDGWFEFTPEVMYGGETTFDLPPLTGRVWVRSQHNGWGDNLTLEKLDEYGHVRLGTHLSMPGRIEAGDLVRTEMSSGVDAYYVVTEVAYERDPADMFRGLAACVCHVTKGGRLGAAAGVEFAEV